MEILGDLPSIPSSIFSRKDIELFDKYRDDYRGFAKKIKFVLDNINRTYDTDKLWTRFGIESSASSSIINMCSITGSYDLRFMPRNSRGFVEEIPSCYLRHQAELIPMFLDGGCPITAFYIPEYAREFKLFIKPWNGKEEILVAHYERPDKNQIIGKSAVDIIGDWRVDFDLENLLRKSKEFPFSDDETSRQHKLETILEDSKKRLVLRNNCGEETIYINGINYMRLSSLIQPVLCHSFLWHVDFIGEVVLPKKERKHNKLTSFYTEINTLTYDQKRELSKERKNIFMGKLKGNLQDGYILYKFEDGNFIKLS